MSRKLEELFDLPSENNRKPDTVMIDPLELICAQRQLDSANELIDRIDQALPQVRDLDTADAELDELSDLAKEKFQDMLDLGMNVEARFSGQILQTAGVLLGHAISAKQAKIDKKLRTIDLQLKKLRLDQTAAKKEVQTLADPIEGQAMVVDRNSLLRQILESRKAEE